MNTYINQFLEQIEDKLQYNQFYDVKNKQFKAGQIVRINYQCYAEVQRQGFSLVLAYSDVKMSLENAMRLFHLEIVS